MYGNFSKFKNGNFLYLKLIDNFLRNVFLFVFLVLVVIIDEWLIIFGYDYLVVYYNNIVKL